MRVGVVCMMSWDSEVVGLVCIEGWAAKRLKAFAGKEAR